METTGRPGANLSINREFVRKILVEFIRDETRNAGFERGIVGLSGGVDSAVCAFLAAEAFGHENVIAVMMPYRTSSPESLSDAEAVVTALGVRSEVVDISPMVDPFLDRAGIRDNVRSGNVMARQRMIVLYDVSSREEGLVLGTSNKTELLLGYGTLFGDMASALNPLGDLYKTQVWQLAEHLGVPGHIIEKRPTADLWEGQTDEDELGFSYTRVDHLLYLLVDERRTDEELGASGFEEGMIDRVKKMVARNQFKRRPPVIAKISHRTVNIDFRYPRDWGI
ncbi:MAG: NAD+ synthase [Bacteroidota bacterium]